VVTSTEDVTSIAAVIAPLASASLMAWLASAATAATAVAVGGAGVGVGSSRPQPANTTNATVSTMGRPAAAHTRRYMISILSSQTGCRMTHRALAAITSRVPKT
jgi:hypothetical protein